MLGQLQETARTVCAVHGGIVAELRGDAVLAVFGIPVAHEDDAQRALRAAAELGRRTGQLPFGFCSSFGRLHRRRGRAGPKARHRPVDRRGGQRIRTTRPVGRVW